MDGDPLLQQLVDELASLDHRPGDPGKLGDDDDIPGFYHPPKGQPTPGQISILPKTPSPFTEDKVFSTFTPLKKFGMIRITKNYFGGFLCVILSWGRTAIVQPLIASP